MLPPLPLFHMRKFFKYFPRCSPLHPPHDGRWRYIRRRHHQDMDMILTDHPLQDLNLVPLTSLGGQVLVLGWLGRPPAWHSGTWWPRRGDIRSCILCSCLDDIPGCQYKSAASRMLPAWKAGFKPSFRTNKQVTIKVREAEGQIAENIYGSRARK